MSKERKEDALKVACALVSGQSYLSPDEARDIAKAAAAIADEIVSLTTDGRDNAPTKP